RLVGSFRALARLVDETPAVEAEGSLWPPSVPPTLDELATDDHERGRREGERHERPKHDRAPERDEHEPRRREQASCNAGAAEALHLGSGADELEATQARVGRLHVLSKTRGVERCRTGPVEGNGSVMWLQLACHPASRWFPPRTG